MKKFLILSAATAVLALFATAVPADAAARKAGGVTAVQSGQLDLSARRRYRRHVYRYHRHYVRPYYYYPYGYYYRPRYYYPYAYYPYYYRRPGLFIGFSF